MDQNLTVLDNWTAYVPLSQAHLLTPSYGWELAWRVMYTGVLSILGSVTNLTALVLLLRSSLLGSWTYRMVVQLVLTDLLFCVLMAAVMFPAVVMERWPYGVVMCQAVMSIGILLPGVTLCSFLFTSLHRYVAIVHNKAGLKVFSTRWQPYILVAIWVILLIAILPFVIIGDAFVLYWPDQCFILSTGPLFETLRYTIVGLVTLGSTATLLLYVMIYYHIRKMSAAQSSTIKARQRNIFGLFYVYLTFAGNFIPIVVLVAVGPAMDVRSQRIFHLVAWNLCMLCLSVNPFIYAIVFRDVRSLYQCRKNSVHVIDGSKGNNTQETVQ